jgi:hypothetical protein
MWNGIEKRKKRERIQIDCKKVKRKEKERMGWRAMCCVFITDLSRIIEAGKESGQ